MEMFTLIGNGFIIVGICALFLGFGHFLKRSTLWKSGLFGLITYAVSGILVQVVKHLVGRPRPRFLESNIHHWGPSLTSGFDSFPSGHATSAFALALLLSHFYPGGKILFFGGAALVSFSRLYVDAHFASDLLGGALLGLGTSLILLRYVSRPRSLALQEGGNTRSEAHAPYHDP
jgi:undecaprenyl-diphosphatase